MATLKVSIDKELDIAEYRFEGEIVYSELRDSIKQYYSGTLTKYTVWDFSATNVQNVRNSEIMTIANQVSVAGQARDNCFDVIIVSELFKYGLARIYAGYAESIQKNPAALKTMVFRTREHAYDWIRAHESLDRANKAV